MAAPIYREQSAEPMKTQIEELRSTADTLKDQCDVDLWVRLHAAIDRVEEAAKATIPITKAGRTVGYGINKAEKAIACDHLISVVKQIKALRAW